jgi:hypothetical protein
MGWKSCKRSDYSIWEKECFYDIKSIGIGNDFVEEINKTINRADRALVVIGPHWLDIKDEEGNLTACLSAVRPRPPERRGLG